MQRIYSIWLAVIFVVPICRAKPTLVPGNPGPGADSAWFQRVSEQLRRDEYVLSPAIGSPGSWSAPNREQGLRIGVSAGGLVVVPRSECPGKSAGSWSLGLCSSRMGRADSLEPIGAAKLAVQANRAVLDHGLVQESFENTEVGLKQEWTIRTRPSGTGPVAIELGIEGSLSLCIAADGRSATLSSPVAEARLRYNELFVFDASGKLLRSWLAASADGLRIVFDDADAQYPVLVDPVLAGADWTSESDQASASYGAVVASAGDVNGDGFDDVIVGAPNYDNGQINEGRAFCFLGSPTGPSISPSWTAENNIAGSNFASAAASAGDVNGDGYSDVIIGAWRYDGTNGPLELAGRAYVYLGSASGLSTTPAWSETPEAKPWYFGYCVASAGDVNGDGYGDVIIGAPNYQCCGLGGEGRAYVYYGSASGLSSPANWTYHGTLLHDTLGIAVAGAGDVNGDGYSDVIVGTWQSTNRALVFLGSSGGLMNTPVWTASGGRGFGWSLASAGDVNGDGFDDVIVGEVEYDAPGLPKEGRAHVFYGSATGPSPTAGWIVEGNQASAFFGSPVASAGDFNGDGFSDVIVGATAYDSGQIDEGAAFLFLGSACGLEATPARVFEENQSGSSFGVCAGAGDTNGDGYSDLIIGAPGYDNGQVDEGRVFVYFGDPATVGSSMPAPNDEAVDALVAPPGNAPWSLPFDTTCASTSSCASSCTIHKDVWYRIEATSCLDITASVSGASGAVVIAVYDGTDCGVSPVITCGVSPQGFSSQAGRVYLLRVGTSTPIGVSGTFTVIRTPTSGPLTCPPSVSPVATRVYSFVGPANNTEWAWALTSCSFCGIANFHVQPVASGTAYDVVQRFKDSIDQAGCSSVTVTAVESYTNDMPPQVKGLMTVHVLGSTGCTPVPFTLGVGPKGGPIDCYPTIAGGCTVNPIMHEVPLSGTDCNGNGIDDVLDISLGTSLDRNGNLVPDECELVVPICVADDTQVTPCPCANVGLAGRGCNNSTGTGGAYLVASGSTSPDTIVLTSSFELPTALSIFLQGSIELGSGVAFGDGIRCVGGSLHRLYVKSASGGGVSAPSVGNLSVSAQSAFLGDAIVPGTNRYYQVYYRDPSLLFCPTPTGNAWNVSSGVRIRW